MGRFLVQRNIPGAGKLSSEQLDELATHSCDAMKQMQRDGVQVHWEQSFVTADKIFCVYNAPDENSIREHSALGGFPVTTILAIDGTISPGMAS